MSPKEITKAIAHLKGDKNLRKIIEKSPRPKFTKGGDPFEALVRSIIFQQLSGKSAGAILKRVHALFKDGKPSTTFSVGKVVLGKPTPRKVLKLYKFNKLNRLRECGLSGQKIIYLKDLASKFLDGTVNPNNFHDMTDEAIRQHLIAVKGIGRWTVDMFLIFTLHRPDVLPTGDLGIQKGFQKVFNLKKLPDVKKMEKLAEVWQPYRTIASWYLWLAVDATGENNW